MWLTEVRLVNVANAALQNATRQLRFHLLPCLAILTALVALEILRYTMKLFVKASFVGRNTINTKIMLLLLCLGPSKLSVDPALRQVTKKQH